MMITRLPLLALAFPLASLACDARTLIGEVPDGSVPDVPGSNQTVFQPVGTSGHTCAPPQFPGDHPYDFPAGVEGVWTGYVEGSTLGLSSDAVRLTLDRAANGTTQIHIVYGVAAPPPPATSATEAYPPGSDPVNRPAGSGYPIEGFAYTAHNVDWQAFGQQWRLRFLIDNAEPWGSWCRLQSSYADPTNGSRYGCLPNTGGGSMTSPDGSSECYLNGSPPQPVPCAQFWLCLGNYVCGCDQCGCDMQGVDYAGVPSGPGNYDILFDASTAAGGSIHLMRAAN